MSNQCILISFHVCVRGRIKCVDSFFKNVRLGVNLSLPLLNEVGRVDSIMKLKFIMLAA